MLRFWSVIFMSMFAFTLAMAGGGGAAPDIKVIHAEGKIFYHEIYVSWSTEYERTSCDFIVEASEDGKDWRIRGRMRSHGAADSHAEYNFVDARDTKLHHYRIRRTDSRGQMETLSEFQLADYSINVTLEEVVIDKEKKLLIE